MSPGFGHGDPSLTRSACQPPETVTTSPVLAQPLSQKVSDAKAPRSGLVSILNEVNKESLNAVPEVPQEWERVVMVIDSGASVPVMPPEHGKAYPLEESEASRRGAEYECANGHAIANVGQKRMPVMTAEGTLRGYSTQCADVTKPLQSVRHLCKNHHTVVFDDAGSYIHNKNTGEVNWIVDDGINYTMEVWIVPPAQLQAVAEHVNAQSGFPRPT